LELAIEDILFRPRESPVAGARQQLHLLRPGAWRSNMMRA
jgi:hypothetical protein